VVSTPEKPAQPQTAAQPQEGQLVLQPGRGRPQRAADAPKLKYTTLSGQQKAYLVSSIQAALDEGSSLKKAQAKFASKLKVGLSTVKAHWRNRAEISRWAAEADRRPSQRAGTSKRRGERASAQERASTGKGCRQPKSRGYLGKTQHCRRFADAVKIWADVQQAQGHELWPADLLSQYTRQLRSAIVCSVEEQSKGLLSPEAAVELAAWQLKAKNLETSQDKREWQKRYLLGHCGLLKRKKQRATAYTEEQEIEAAVAGWRCFGYLADPVTVGNFFWGWILGRFLSCCF
jgi:hypothetical protein